MNKFNQIVMQIITDNPQIQQRGIWAKAIDQVGFHVSLNAVRQACREMEEAGLIHYSRKNKLGINGYFVGKAPEKPNKPKALPKYMRDEQENEPLKTYPRPGVTRVRMAHSNVGMKPAKVISTGIGSSFAMYDGI